MKSKLAWSPWVLSVLLSGIGPAAAAPNRAERGVATFVHGAGNAAPGGSLPLVLVVYGFSQLTEAAPLAGAGVELAWDVAHLDPADIARAPKPVVATTDANGTALVTAQTPRGAGPWTLLVRTTHGDHERVDELKVGRADAETVRLAPSVTRARSGDAVHAWVEVSSGMRPIASTQVRFDVREGDIAVQTVWGRTDASGRVDTELRLPKSDALLSGWSIVATTERGSSAGASIALKDDTPTDATLRFEPVENPPKPGGELLVIGEVLDATGEPVRDVEIETWSGPSNLAVDTGTPRWTKIAQKIRSDASGKFRVTATMPTVIGRSGLVWMTRVAASVNGERIHADHLDTIGRSAHSVRLVHPSAGVVPGFRDNLALVVEDDHGEPAAGAEFRVEADGLQQTVRSNERGEALVEWNIPLGVGTTRKVEPCSGSVAANVAVVAQLSALRAGFPARTDLCLPVDRETQAQVRVDSPIVRAGEPVRVQVIERASGKAAASTFSLVARSEDDPDSSATRIALTRAGAASIPTTGLEAGAYTISALGISAPRDPRRPSSGDRQPALGHFLVVPARMPRPSATLRSQGHVPNGHATIDVKLLDDAGKPFQGTVGAIVTERRFDDQSGALAMDVRRRYCSEVNGALRCDDTVTANSPRQKLAPAYLAEPSTHGLGAHRDPMHTAYADATKTFTEVVTSLEGAIYEASGSRETLQDVLRKEGGKNRFNPELLTLAVQALSEPPLTPGGAPVALADLASLDPQVDYDHVARRVARFKLFKVLDALREARRSKDSVDVSFDDPNAALRRLLAAHEIEESALIDPWGGSMAFVRVNGAEGNAQAFLSPKRGYALHAPGPDGRLGTADDVKSPFERVLRSGTPYAVASQEDRVVDAPFQLEVAQSSIDSWRSTLDEATGTALGNPEESGGGRGEGIGLGGGSGRGFGAGRMGLTRVRQGAGFRAIVAPRPIGADGSVQLSVPLGADEGVYRVLLVGDVPGLGRLVQSVDVTVQLQRSLRLQAGERWVVGDRGEIAVVVENRAATPATLDVLAEASTDRISFSGARTTTVTVPAHGRREVPLHVAAARVGEAKVQVALREAGRIVDRYESSWHVVPAGEPVMLAEAAWVRGESRIPRPAAPGHVANGAQFLTVQSNGNDALRAALMAVEPARLRERVQAEDARRAALAVQHYAAAQNDTKLATLADAVEQRARGRAAILPTAFAKSKTPPRDGCPSIPLDRLLRDDPGATPKTDASEAQRFERFDASAQCFDQQINQRVEDLLARGETLDLARAILELAEHEAREPLTVALALELRKRVRLTPSGRMMPPDRQDHVARTLVFAALLRTAHIVTNNSKIDGAALIPWLLVEQDAHGSFGSVEATTAAVRALVASAAMATHAASSIELDDGKQTRRISVPASGVVRVALPDSDEPVLVRVKGAPVLARVQAPTLRTYRTPPLPPASAPEVRVDWPETARLGESARLSVRVAPRAQDGSAELRIPLPANLVLAQKPQNGARLIDHVLRIPVPKVGLATQLSLRVMQRGQFTAPEGGLYENGERRAVIPARVLAAR